MALGRGGLEQIGAEAVFVVSSKAVNDLINFTNRIETLNKSVTNLERASNPFDGLVKGATAASAAVGLAVTAIVGAIGAVSGASFKVAADFEQSLGTVGAITRASSADLARLTDTIRDISSASITGLGDAAFAAGELAKAGIDIQDQIGGALKAVNDLTIASAGELGLERAALLVGSAIKAFNLTGADAERVANALTAAAQQSAISFVDLQRSFQQVSPLGAALGFTVEELAAALGVMGEAGIRGSDAGTSLKQAFIQLEKPSKKALELMTEYGISLFTAEGKARPLRDLIIDLEKNFGEEAIALGKVTVAQAQQAQATIFGSDAIRASLVLAARGVDSFDKFTESTKDVTFSAKELARIMQQPLNAQLQIFGNNIVILAERIGAGFITPLKGAVTQLIQFARQLQPIAVIMGATIAAIGTGQGFGSALERLDKIASFDIQVGFRAFLILVENIKSAIVDGIIPAFGRFGIALEALFGKAFGLQDVVKTFFDLSRAVQVAGAVVISVLDFFSDLATKIAASESSLRNFRTALIAIAIAPIVGIAVAFTAITAAIIAAHPAILLVSAAIVAAIAVVTRWADVWTLVEQQVNATIGGLIRDIQDAATEVNNSVTDIGAAAVGIKDAIGGAFSAIGEAVSTLITGLQADFAAFIAESGQAFSTFGAEVNKIFEEEFGDILRPVRETFAAIGSALDFLGSSFRKSFDEAGPAADNASNFIKESFVSALGFIGDRFSELGTTVRQAVEPIGKAFDFLGTALRRSFDAVGPALTQAFAGFGPAFSAAGELVSKLVDVISDQFNSMVQVVGVAVSGTIELVGKIPTPFNTVIGFIAKFIKALIDLFKDLIQALGNFLNAWSQTWSSAGSIMAGATKFIVDRANEIIGALNAIPGRIGTIPSIEVPDVAGPVEDQAAPTIAIIDRIGARFATLGTSVNKTVGTIGTAFETLGTSIRNAQTTVEFAASNFQSRILAIRTSVNTGLNEAFEEAAKRLAALNQRLQETTGSTDGLGDGLGKAGKAAKEAGSAFEGFADALAKAIRLQAFIEAFGDVGAKAVNALVDAVVSNIDKDGAKAAEALHEFTQFLRKENIEDWENIAADAQSAFAHALIERSDEAIEAAIEIVQRAADAIKAQGRLTVDTFRAAFNLGALKQQLGSDGAKLLDDFKKAITEGGTDVVRAVGVTASEMAVRFRELLPPELAFDVIGRLMTAIKTAIQDGTPAAVRELQNTIKQLNFEAQFLKLARDTSNAINVVLEDSLAAILEIEKKAREEAEKIIRDSEIVKALDEERKQIEERIKGGVDLFKAFQAAAREGRQDEREQRDLDTKRAREDVDREEERARLIIEARKRLSDKLREQAKQAPVVNPQGFTRLDDEDNELKKLKERFALEDQLRATQRQREDTDRTQKKQDRADDLLFNTQQQQALEGAQTKLNTQLETFNKILESKRLQEQVDSILKRGAEDVDKIQLQVSAKITEQNTKFDEQHGLLLDIQSIADIAFDGALADSIAILENVKKTKKELGIALITEVEGVDNELDSMSGGGTIPGPRGRPRLIVAHGQERIIPASVAAAESRILGPVVGGGSTTSNVTYQVNAQYDVVRSEATLTDDMVALMMLAGK